MGSSEVLDWLINQRKKGNHSFFKTSEIMDGLKAEGENISRTYTIIRGLHEFGFLEVEVVNISYPRWRVKLKYVR